MSRLCKTLLLNLSTHPEQTVAGEPHYVYPIHNIIDTDALDHHLVSQAIDFHDLFNNLDGDDRHSSRFDEANNAGTVLMLASMLVTSDMVDDATHQPGYLQEYLDGLVSANVYDQLDTTLEDVYNQTNIEENISAYVFGRSYMDKISFNGDDCDMREEAYHASCNVLWELITILGSDVREVYIIYEIYNYFISEGVRFKIVADWRGDIMTVQITIVSDHDIRDVLPIKFFINYDSRGYDDER